MKFEISYKRKLLREYTNLISKMRYARNHWIKMDMRKCEIINELKEFHHDSVFYIERELMKRVKKQIQATNLELLEISLKKPREMNIEELEIYYKK